MAKKKHSKPKLVPKEKSLTVILNRDSEGSIEVAHKNLTIVEVGFVVQYLSSFYFKNKFLEVKV